ncbi:TonB-dependent receptor [Rasiella rasia]|uniref:TonB-dependent receptor n=1 Tax=Rasiella rasia TaxID=2744027 RepID=A0A6G6GJ55_9FLAO|nr:TonB-dependent receptor [Rasiella rasia]QIE58582.1 TonB-dependent receptor [Rasiella rasia]
MKFIYLMVLALVSPYVLSQNCNLILSGTVIDLHDQSVLAGATVIVAGVEKAVVTDFDGNFKINNLCEGTYNLQISHPECKTEPFTVVVTEDVQQTFQLEHHLEALEQVLVTARGFVTKTESLLENKLATDVIDTYSGASLGDALRQISGVSSLTTGNAVVKPIINGLHSSRITTINNGVRQQDQEWGAEHSPNIDLNTAGSITVLKGASALQYSGDAIGGIVIVEPLPVRLTDSLYGKTILTGQTNGRGGALTTQLTKSYESGWFARVQGSVKGYGDFETPDYILSNTGVNEQNLSASFGVNKLTYGFNAYYSLFKSTLGILRASHIGGAQDQVASINSGEPSIIRDFTYDIDVPRQEVTHHLAKFSGFMELNNLGKLAVQYDFQANNRFEFDVRRGDDDKPSVDLELKTHTLMVDLTSKLNSNVNLKTGLVASYQNNFANPDTGVRRLIPDYDQYKMAGFAILDATINERLVAEAGARFDYTFIDALKFYRTSFWESRNYDVLFPDLVVDNFGNQILVNPELHFNNFSATLGAAYTIDEDYTLFANYSLASRAPNASELFSEGLHHSASRIELGDLRFTSEMAQKITATLQKKHGKIQFSINPYVNFINDFILIEPTGIEQTIRGNFQVWEYRQTQARLLGVDTDFSAEITERLTFNNQFSIVKGQDTTLDEALINMPPAQIINGLQYKLPILNESFLGLESTYVFEQNEFPNNNFEVFLPSTETFEVVDISTPPSAYHLLGLKAGTVFNYMPDNTMAVTLTVNNLLDTPYRDYLNRLRYYADDLGRTIQLQIKINY